MVSTKTFFVKLLAFSVPYRQDLNWRGEASLHRDLSSGCPEEKDLLIPVEYSTKVRGKIDSDGGTLQPSIGKDLFFSLYLILAKKHFDFRRRPFFGFYLILAKKHFDFRRRPFFGLHLILAKKRFDFRQRLFFWSLFNFVDGIT